MPRNPKKIPKSTPASLSIVSNGIIRCESNSLVLDLDNFPQCLPRHRGLGLKARRTSQPKRRHSSENENTMTCKNSKKQSTISTSKAPTLPSFPRCLCRHPRPLGSQPPTSKPLQISKPKQFPWPSRAAIFSGRPRQEVGRPSLSLSRFSKRYTDRSGQSSTDSAP